LERRKHKSIPLFNVVWAEVADGSITIHHVEQKSKTDVAVRRLSYPVSQEQNALAEGWTRQLLDLAYGRAQRQKRIKVLINPFSGKGRAPKLYSRQVEPVFAAARCIVDVQTTTHQGHAEEIAENLDVDAYDAIAPCSGDGLVYEVFNGLSRKPNASEALAKIAVTHLPSGSGNAMSWNLNGTGSAGMAALCIVKGLRTPFDLVSVTQGGRRTVSFLSQAFGLIAESDLGTDHLRWMGRARFTYGFLVRLLGRCEYPCDLALRVEIDDKEAIRNHYQERVKQGCMERLCDEEGPSQGLPPLKYGTATDPLPEGWELVPHPRMGNFYAGKMAFMAADAVFFPASLPNDGLMDVIVVSNEIGRWAALKMMKAAKKVTAYRLIPRKAEGIIAIDGESIPFEPFQVEIHRGLGTVLSRSGYKYEARGLE
jgi:sphingosine kinase